MQELFAAISQVGFPIVVALLLIIRIESRMEQMGKQIGELKDAIVQLNTLIGERLKRR